MAQHGSAGDVAGKERVQVAVRIRPFLETDPEDAELSSIMVDSSHFAVGEKRVFRVDRVFGMADENDAIFHDMVEPLVASFLQGYSATIMAYGQTGSGKTFTMNGLIPEVLHQILTGGAGGPCRLEDFSFQCLEVYGDDIRDLFSPNPEASAAAVRLYEGSARDLVIAADSTVQLLPAHARATSPRLDAVGAGSRGVQVIGARRLKARSLAEVLQFVDSSAAVRATAATRMNVQSSRSHSLFTVFHDRKGCKLHLVDLAGSERYKKTQNAGRRFQESVAINTGLFALGNVIRALARRSGASSVPSASTSPLLAMDSASWPSRQAAASPYIPYRSGKLTRLLQDALGGHSKTLFIACVAPDGANQAETLRTAQYCSLAMKVLNAPLREYDQLKRRQTQGMRPASGSRGNHTDAHVNPPTHDCVEVDMQLAAAEEERDRLLQQVELLRDELHATYDYVDACEEALAEDAATFGDQITVMQRLVEDKARLTARLHTLEATATEKRAESQSHALPFHGREAANTVAKPVPRDEVPTPLSSSSARRTANAQGNHPLPRLRMSTENSNEQPPGFEPSVQNVALIHDDLAAHLSRPRQGPPATASGAIVHVEEESAPDALLQLQRRRDEQMMQLAQEALSYQRHNADLRSKLSAMVTLLETHQREAALVRIELENTRAALAQTNGASLLSPSRRKE